MSLALDFDRPKKTKSPKMEIEVIIDDMNQEAMLIRLDEDAKPKKIPRYGIKITEMKEPYATLSLSESRAISYNLV